MRPTKLEDVTVPFRRGDREVCRVRRYDRVPAFDDLCPRQVPQLGAIVDITVPSKTVLIPGVLGSGTRDEENTKRSGNASVKNPEHLALGIAMKRLVRGPWFAALCAAMAAACENIHWIVDRYQERLNLAHRNRKNGSTPPSTSSATL